MQHPLQTVLVVDDHRDTAEMFAELLREVGFDSHTANNGLDALRVYDALRPALIITDECLVGTITGSDLVRALRRKYGAAVVRALFLTGAPDAVRALPTDVVLEKPVELDTLIAAVRSILGKPPAARESY
jgi:DNA-binding response OmpR family regulator